MDLTKFSTDDLVALKAGDLSKVSTQGLKLLKEEAFASKVTAQQEKDRAEYDPAKDMSAGQRFLAGAGKAVSDLGLGIRQRLGMADQTEVDATAKRDATLMNTTAGKVGNVTGAIGSAVPAAFIPGANTLAGAGAIGAVQGALQPTGENESVVKNALTGAGLGAGGVVAGRTLGAAYQGAKGLVEPFYGSGRQRIVGRTIERFAADPAAVRSASAAPTATGAVPTLAEASRDTGIASLQRAIEQLDPAAAAVAGERAMSNNAARINALQQVAGDPAKRAAAVAARESAAGPLYQASDAAVVPLDSAYQNLLKRPAFANAVQRADELARNEGLDGIFFRGADGQPVAVSGQGAHYIKKALDDMAEKGGSTYMGKAAAQSAGKTQADFLSWLEKSVPEYGQARQAFAEGSKPISAMDVGQRLLDKTTSATRDMAGNRRMQANAFARALNDEEQLLRQSTGFKGNNALADVMKPDDLKLLNAIRDELELSANLSNAANGPGSQTAKSLASQNIVRQMLGPTGLPQSWAESSLMQTALRPVQFALNAAEPRITGELANALMDPTIAKAAIEAAKKQPALKNALAPYMSTIKAAATVSVPSAGLMARQRSE